MRLISVVYKLLDGEAAYLDTLADLRAHELGCELLLNFDDAPTCFVTWASSPCQYCIGVFEKPQFEGQHESRDMSGSAPWRELIGRDISLTYLDESHQVLRAGDESKAVFLSSVDDAGGWQADVLRITDHRPQLST